jgi:hypothetical protein
MPRSTCLSARQFLFDNSLLMSGPPGWINPHFILSMIERLLPTLTFLAALSCGLAAGIFYAFSSLVMRALARIPSHAGIAAMQSINVSVINPWFMEPFLDRP